MKRLQDAKPPPEVLKVCNCHRARTDALLAACRLPSWGLCARKEEEQEEEEFGTCTFSWGCIAQQDEWTRSIVLRTQASVAVATACKCRLQAATREYKRLQRSNDQSPGHAMSRAYLETLADLPWSALASERVVPRAEDVSSSTDTTETEDRGNTGSRSETAEEAEDGTPAVPASITDATAGKCNPTFV